MCRGNFYIVRGVMFEFLVNEMQGKLFRGTQLTINASVCGTEAEFFQSHTCLTYYKPITSVAVWI